MAMRLRERYPKRDHIQERKRIMDAISNDHKVNDRYHLTTVENKNIMLIGRTRAGRSTLKSLLVNPTYVSDEPTLKSRTRDLSLESFYIDDKSTVLNIIDTPGLFERTGTEMTPRDNDTILRIIELCVNREITKLHVVCFCITLAVGIIKEDIDSLKLLVDFFGQEISNNSCLIITHCESKNHEQRHRMCYELERDLYFQEIASFFRLGIFFSGSLDRDDYNQANHGLIDQFLTISDYRTKLIELFTRPIEPCSIHNLLISEVKRACDQVSLKESELQEIQVRVKKQALIIEELRQARLNHQ